ncbi:MAG: hypothetical protein ABSB77_15480 [Xanthobacteraceae bacterium]
MLVGLMSSAGATARVFIPAVVVAQAMVPPTGMDDANNPMPMVERMNRRFPQPVRVGDLIGLPVLDDRSSTLGFVSQVVRTPAGRARTQRRCRTTPLSESRWRAIERSRLCETDNFLVFAELYRVRRK